MASSTSLNLSSLRAALPSITASSSVASVSFLNPKRPSSFLNPKRPSELKLSRLKSGPRPLKSFVGLDPLLPLLSPFSVHATRE
ncbi:hypothetical protein OROGR_033027 [Orobanche gracilis]